MKYLKRRKFALITRALALAYGVWGSIYFIWFMLAKNPEIKYWIGIALTVFWILTIVFTVDMARGILKIIKENIDVYAKEQSDAEANISQQ